MDNIGTFRRDEMREAARVQGHGERVLGVRGKWHEDAAIGLQLARHPATLTSNERARPRCAERGRDIDRRPCRGIHLQVGNDLKHGGAGQGMRGPVLEWQPKNLHQRTSRRSTSENVKNKPGIS